MTTKKIVSMAAMTFFAALSTTKAGVPAEELLCRTSDGVVRITANSVSLRDYTFTIDRVSGDGVVQLRDVRTGATAELDARENDGFYLAIREGGQTMQVVAPRTTMQIQESADVPASPAISAVAAQSPAAAQQVNLRWMVSSQR